MRQRLGGLAPRSFKARFFLRPPDCVCISPAVSVSGSKRLFPSPSPISLRHAESTPCFERTRRGAPSLRLHPRLHNHRQKSASCSLDDLDTICILDFGTLDLGLSPGSLFGVNCCFVCFMGMFGFPAKRPRDPDGSVDLEDNAIHEKKRPRSLPLRTSPNACVEVDYPSALTPVESSDDDDLDNRKLAFTTAVHTIPELSGTAMDVDAGRDPPLVTDDGLTPWPASARNNNGRAQPSPIPRTLINQSLNIGGHQTLSAPNSIPVDRESGMSARGSSSAENQDSASSHCPRLPSPVSEDEDVPAGDSKASPSDAEMSYTLSLPGSPRLGIPYQDQGLWTHDPAMQLSGVDSSTSPEEPIGTTQPRKKTTFFMGYRADCEKCRQKIPGHYSHIIRA